MCCTETGCEGGRVNGLAWVWHQGDLFIFMAIMRHRCAHFFHVLTVEVVKGGLRLSGAG